MERRLLKKYGYENSVIPQLERAIFGRPQYKFFGTERSSKTRLARQMVNLLDEWIPVIKESEINDDPTSPFHLEERRLLKIMETKQK